MVPERKVLRILDANLNRASEGLRVAEEVARFLLDDAGMQKKLKRLRHELRELAAKTLTSAHGGDGRMRVIIGSRDSAGDVGGNVLDRDETKRPDLSSIIQSNCSRAAESVRVFEEFSKLLSGRQTAGWKKLRFRIYAVEKELLSLAAGKSNAEKLREIGLYCIVDRTYLGRRNAASAAKEMINGGAKIIQYRDKLSEDAKFLRACREVRKACSEKGVLFIVNDRADMALLVDADGLHVGQGDMPVRDARKLLGPGKIIGKSSHTFRESVAASREDIDYLAVGAIFPTKTKMGHTVVGPEYIARVKKKVAPLPVVAIGGINHENIGAVLTHKPDGICIVSAIQQAPDIAAAVRGFTRIISRGGA